ncbi:MAG: endopeptidase La [Myxococcota bacterium]
MIRDKKHKDRKRKGAGLPLLNLREHAAFPHCITSLFVNAADTRAVKAALGETEQMLIAGFEALIGAERKNSDIATLGRILSHRPLADGRLRIVFQGLSRVRIKKLTRQNGCAFALYDELSLSPKNDPAILALMQSLRETLSILPLDADVLISLEGVEDGDRFADIVAGGAKLNERESYDVLNKPDVKNRLLLLNEILVKRAEIHTLKEKLNAEIKQKVSRSEREFYLKEQLRAIQKELGTISGAASEEDRFVKRINESPLPEYVREEALAQLRKLSFMHADLAEAALTRAYLDWLIALPWGILSDDRLDIKSAKETLDEDHYDLRDVKQRILEFLAVRKLAGNSHGSILCFIGPPGVGKTSLGRSIAKAMNRKFVRLSLGGISDEAEIRGHRRTYVGAMPGKIIQAIRQAATANPVFMLDEIDKIGAGGRGDPSAALLEVLDPEQNHQFTDHYINLPFDLSKALFIGTANVREAIPPVLRDRLEIIEISGYSEDDKLKIAREFIIPKEMTRNGLADRSVSFSQEALSIIISQYTREAGLRELGRRISAILRKIALEVAEGSEVSFNIRETSLLSKLGAPPYLPAGEARRDGAPGVAPALARTATGGEILFVEAEMMPGKPELTLTGQLGEVMRESAKLALSYLQAKSDKYEFAPQMFEKFSVHIHVPQGAVPKDGPSAGASIVTALFSLFTQTPIAPNLAMTGEITLKGKILGVGGIKDKLLAAHRGGIKIVLIPAPNRKDIQEAPPDIRRKLEIIYVQTIDELLRVAFRYNCKTDTGKAIGTGSKKAKQ